MRLPQRPALLAGFLLSLLVSIGLHWTIFPLEIQGRHNWRQSQTMWNVRNFLHYDNDIRNTRVSHFNGSHDNLLRYEFPVLQWSIAQVQRAVGESVLVARVVVWLVGVFGLAGFFLLLRTKGVPPGISLVGTVLLQFCPLFYFYTVNVLPDLLALSAGIWYLYCCFAYFRDERWTSLFGAVSFLLLATLAKLPFAMFAIVGVVYTLGRVWQPGRRRRAMAFAGLHLLFIVPAVLWYRWVMPGWGSNPVLYGIFGSANSREENLKILDFFLEQYIPYDLLSPPMWGLLLLGILWPATRRTPVPYARYVWALAGVTLVYVALQWNTITVVHDYYLLPLLPWLYIVVTAGAGRIWQWTSGTRARGAGAVLVGAAVLAAPWYAYQLRQPLWAAETGAYYNVMQDAYRHQEALQAAVDDDEKVIALNDISAHIFTWLIRKRGYVFHSNHLQPEWIDDLHRNRGVNYLYSNSRKFDQDSAVQTRLDTLLLEAGDIHVYRIRSPEEN
ncbi:hypothetical protein GGR26_000326 [Lewinella marina]|uniref:Glycosyltransferase RgtA/B/C/D-like domain-containing protein n=1 Tax=Neolewinella marina TaxID=438751 RepID=A0A2G0CJU0_9BACT|nr:glycosyltransferase family 39 protein [Neolewinella marina]NJB84581.1 hypothetical protein [Neolewinella marina]PHL00239.1 hypothetical protein CGL56_04160 [Neolewinella marina]